MKNPSIGPGRQNQQIACEVFISKKTVAFPLDHVYTRTGIGTRTLVGIRAMQQGFQAEAARLHSESSGRGLKGVEEYGLCRKHH